MKTKKELIKVSLLFAVIVMIGVVVVWQVFAGTFKTSGGHANRWTDGLVGYWSFDGPDMDWGANQATDRSGNSNNGTIYNMSTTSSPVPGKVGSALEFDGSNDAIDIGDIEIGAWTEISVEAWFKTTATASNQRIMGKDQVGVQGNFNFWYGATQKWEFVVQDTVFGGWRRAAYASEAPNDGKWHHLVGTVNQTDDKVYLYLDGVQVGSDDFIAATLDDSDNEEIVIGADSDVGSFDQVFDGSIDEVRLYNRALSAAEIAEHYKAGAERLAKINTGHSGRYTGGLVGYWSFDGPDMDWGANQATDGSGNSNNGVITNMSTTTSPVPGKVGSALDFDGVDDYVDLGDMSQTEGVSALSVGAWVKPTDVSGNNYIVGKYGPSGSPFYTDRSWVFAVNSGTVSFGIIESTGNTRYRSITADTLTINQFYHVVGVFEDNVPIKIYIDGSEASGYSTQETPPSGMTIRANNTNAQIGKYGGGGNYFDGIIDEVRIYDRALSAAEIAEHYKAGAERLAKINTGHSGRYTGGLVGYWSFDGPDMDWGANQATDGSGNSNNGVITNMSTTTSPVPGKVGQALDFDGVDDYVDVADSVSLSFGNGTSDSPFSVSAWIYMDDATKFRVITKANDIVSGTIEWLLSTTGTDKYALFLYDDTSGNQIKAESDTTATADEGLWVHLVATYDGSGTEAGINLYKNGSLEVSTKAEAGTYVAMHNTASAVHIGAFSKDNVTYESYADGTIDEVRIYNRVLSAAEIAEHYLAGVGR